MKMFKAASLSFTILIFTSSVFAMEILNCKFQSLDTHQPSEISAKLLCQNNLVTLTASSNTTCKASSGLKNFLTGAQAGEDVQLEIKPFTERETYGGSRAVYEVTRGTREGSEIPLLTPFVFLHGKNVSCGSTQIEVH